MPTHEATPAGATPPPDTTPGKPPGPTRYALPRRACVVALYLAAAALGVCAAFRYRAWVVDALLPVVAALSAGLWCNLDSLARGMALRLRTRVLLVIFWYVSGPLYLGVTRGWR